MMRKKLRRMRIKYPVTPLEGIEPIPRPGKKHNWNNHGSPMAKAIAFEICGLAPYEKKALELIKSNQERKCRRFLKKRLGNLTRTKRKQDALTAIAREQQ